MAKVCPDWFFCVAFYTILDTEMTQFIRTILAIERVDDA